MKKSVYKQTIEVYNKLGKGYLENSKKVTPPERLPFSKLFSKGSYILDVGCGGGRDSNFFIQKKLNSFVPFVFSEWAQICSIKKKHIIHY